MEFTPLTHCCASGIDFHKTKPVCAWKRQARSTRIPSSFTVAVKQLTEGYYSWQGKKKNFSLCFKRGGLLLVSCSCCCRSQHKWQGNNSSKWSRGQMASEEGLGFSRKKQLRLLDTGRGNIECSFQSSCSSSDQSCNRQAQLCRANNYRAMSSDYYMDNTLQKYRVPVFVMLPLDLIVFGECKQMKLRRVRSLAVALHALKVAGVDGVMVDVWWGAVERHSPHMYDWSAYQDLFHMVTEAGLKAQVIMSFHACVESPFDDKKYVGLPLWISEIGQSNSDIFYRDRRGYYSKEYLSLGIDEIPVLSGRTAVECYEDFMLSFVNTFGPMLGSSIVKITVGLGPAGELRYPSYPQVDGRWQFPGIGEFQCYDKYMLEDLQRAAVDAGEPMWGYSGPHDAGNYNSKPWEAPFFQLRVGEFASDYAHFFLEWYSNKLIQHADTILNKAAKLLKESLEGEDASRAVHLGAKLSGVHWWYRSHSHAAELTAGYYNTSYRDGYEAIAAVLAQHGAALSFPCVEMVDSEHPDYFFCSPEGLLAQVQQVAQHMNVPLWGQNAIVRFDEAAFDRVIYKTKNQTYPMHTFTFLRLGEPLLSSRNWANFVRFVNRMCSKSNGGPPGRSGSIYGRFCKIF